MDKFIRHIRLHVAAYFTPLILAFLLSVGGAGVLIAEIPAEKIKVGFLQAMVVFAQTMSLHDHGKKKNKNSNKRVDELIKLESRRRKDSFKDIHEQFAWDWRFLDEGEMHYKKYVLIKLKEPSMEYKYFFEPDGSVIQRSTDFYIKFTFLHWTMYFCALIGLSAFLHGFFAEITKAGF